MRLKGPLDPDTGFVADFWDVGAAFGPLLTKEEIVDRRSSPA